VLGQAASVDQAGLEPDEGQWSPVTLIQRFGSAPILTSTRTPGAGRRVYAAASMACLLVEVDARNDLRNPPQREKRMIHDLVRVRRTCCQRCGRAASAHGTGIHAHRLRHAAPSRGPPQQGPEDRLQRRRVASSARHPAGAAA
jgi:hypothetical protein